MLAAKKSLAYKILVSLSFLFWFSDCYAKKIGLLIGTNSLGGGHANPMTGSDPWEYKILLVSSSMWELDLSLGQVSLARREYFGNIFYVTFGGGVVANYNEYLAPGIVSSFGIETVCALFCLTFELSQAIGFRKSIIFPASVRVGLIASW